MAHGVALTMRAIQPEYKMYRMENKKGFVCNDKTCRAHRRNLFFKRLPQGLGNMDKSSRSILEAAINYMEAQVAKQKAEKAGA